MACIRASVINNREVLPDDNVGGREYLLYFLHHLLDFRIADVESVIELLGSPLANVTWRRPHGNAE